MIKITTLFTLGDALSPISNALNGATHLINGPESLVAKKHREMHDRITGLQEELDALRSEYEISVGNTQLMQLLNSQLIQALANTTVKTVVMEGQYATVLNELKQKMQSENAPFNPNDSVYGVLLISSLTGGKLALRAVTGLNPANL